MTDRLYIVERQQAEQLRLMKICIAQVAEVTALIYRQHAKIPRATADDMAVLVELMPAVYLRYGQRSLTAAEVLRLPLADDMARLGAVLQRFLHAGGAGSAEKRFGKFLARCAGSVVGGLRLEREGHDESPARYHVRPDD